MARQGAATAVLDGQLVREGDRIGAHTVGAIGAQGLLLRHNVNHSTERLQLLGAAAKQVSGSLQITRHASFTPATQPPPAPPSAPSAPSPPSPPPNDATLTLAGRNAP